MENIRIKKLIEDEDRKEKFLEMYLPLIQEIAGNIYFHKDLDHVSRTQIRGFWMTFTNEARIPADYLLFVKRMTAKPNGRWLRATTPPMGERLCEKILRLLDQEVDHFIEEVVGKNLDEEEVFSLRLEYRKMAFVSIFDHVAVGFAPHLRHLGANSYTIPALRKGEDNE